LGLRGENIWNGSFSQCQVKGEKGGEAQGEEVGFEDEEGGAGTRTGRETTRTGLRRGGRIGFLAKVSGEDSVQALICTKR